MITTRVFILLAFLSDEEEINVGKIIAYNFQEMVTFKKTTLGHNCLIDLLSKKASFLVEAFDIFMRYEGGTNDMTIMV